MTYNLKFYIRNSSILLFSTFKIPHPEDLEMTISSVISAQTRMLPNLSRNLSYVELSLIYLSFLALLSR
jgi:hypothetical protein